MISPKKVKKKKKSTDTQRIEKHWKEEKMES